MIGGRPMCHPASAVDFSVGSGCGDVQERGQDDDDNQNSRRKQ
jgi:hypothetical protein